MASMGLPSHLGASFQLEKDQPAAKCTSYFDAAYFQPEPRIEFALQCASFITSAIDISDGLVGDLGHICEKSNVGATFKAADIPTSDSASCCVSSENLLRAALYGGDDYELCVTVSPHNRRAFLAAAKESGTRVSCIGEITENPEIVCISESNEEIALQSNAYSHFKD